MESIRFGGCSRRVMYKVKITGLLRDEGQSVQTKTQRKNGQKNVRWLGAAG